MDAAQLIIEGKGYLGIEFGSTRIKAVLVDKSGNVLASGGHSWENRYEDGVWTYSLKDIWDGLQDCYKDLKENVKKEYGVTLKHFDAIGFSAMMHGYLAFDENDTILVPFRTWRNTITEEAASKLTAEFNYNIPQRWSIAHLYQAILNGEEHVPYVDFFTTLAGYVHWRLTEEGAALLDPSGDLQAGIPLCPPEGDAGTGMVATNSVAKRTGNISAGTSIFAMVVLEKELSKVYPQIDLVTTPDGALVGMVHCNNCTSDINAWVNLFREFGEMYGLTFDMNDLFTKLYSVALKGDPDCGGMISYNYFSGEPVTGFDAGAPLFVRDAESKFTLANTMRMHLYSALAALKSGMDLMLKEEGVQVDELFGHGGYFKTKGVGQRIAAAAMNAPVSVMETAGEGGAWGIAVLAAFLAKKKDGQSLGEFLNEEIFAGNKGVKMDPVVEDVEGFEKFMEKYMKNLPAEKAAVEAL